jgi:hypothetical protein
MQAVNWAEKGSAQTELVGELKGRYIDGA